MTINDADRWRIDHAQRGKERGGIRVLDAIESGGAGIYRLS